MRLYEQVKSIENENSTYSITRGEVHNKEELLKVIEEICTSISEPTLLTIHVDSHVYERGFGTDFNNLIS